MSQSRQATAYGPLGRWSEGTNGRRIRRHHFWASNEDGYQQSVCHHAGGLALSYSTPGFREVVHAAEVSNMTGTKLLRKDVDNNKGENSPWWMTRRCGIYANGYE